VTADPRVEKIVAIGFLEDWARRSIKAFEAAGLVVRVAPMPAAPHDVDVEYMPVCAQCWGYVELTPADDGTWVHVNA
jgi:hypothetical protein